jgi:integrase
VCGEEGDVVIVLAYTRLRWSELVGLRVGDIDLTPHRLYVRRAALEVEGRIVIGPTKTQGGTRTSPLPHVVVEGLTPRVAGHAADQPAVTSSNGAMLRSNNWRRHTHWNKVLEKSDPAPLTIHDHTYASLPARISDSCRRQWATRRSP